MISLNQVYKKELERDILARHVREFVQRGGVIQKCKPGETGQKPSPLMHNRRYREVHGIERFPGTARKT